MQCQISLSRRASDGRYTARCTHHRDVEYHSETFKAASAWIHEHRQYWSTEAQDPPPYPWREELPLIAFMIMTTIGLTALGLLAIFI
jgi:hypothetical protein